MIEPYVAITVICTGITAVIKQTKIVPDEVLPMISVLVGMLCALVSILYGINIGGGNVIDICAIGIASGLSAVGLYQIPKQIKKMG